MSALRGLVDPTPLRVSPSWRRLWIGTTVSGIGGQMTTVAVLYQVWQLTGSAAWVGVLGLANAVPTVVFGLAGGGLADTADRRRLVLLTTTGLVAVGVLLAVQGTLPGAGAGRLWLLLGLVVVKTCFSALGAPARRSFTALLLPRELVGAGVALDHVAFQLSMLVGPAIAGVVLAAWGVGACYALDVLSFTVGFYGVWRLPALPTSVGDVSDRGGQARLVVQGWRYVAAHPVLRGAVATDLLATVLAMPISLFPAVNAERYGDNPRTLGLFLSAIAVGGIAAGCVWGAGLAAFGLARPLWLALACLAVAGAADTVSVISRGTLMQLATDDAHRGRVSSVELVVGAGGPDLGNLRGGLVAGFTSPGAALVSGGLLCLLGIATVAAAGRDLLRFAVTPEPDDVLAGIEEDLAEGPVRR
jgi:MFS family permease